MSDANLNGGNWDGSILDDLRRRLANGSAGEKREIVAKWVREHTRPEAHDQEVHEALSVRDILREVMDDIVESKPNKKLVLVIHGIRDQGEWMEMVQVRLRDIDVVVQPVDFEYIDVVRFMLGFGVNGVVERVLSRIRNAKANNEGAELIIIAHSFGTYVVSRILRDHPDIRFSRAIFCGSVIPRNFRFDRVAHCPRIINECGGRDIWPVIAQGFSFRYSYGTAGVWGLRSSGVEDRFHDIGHADYLTSEFVDKFWKPYVDYDIIVPSPYQGKRRVTPICVSLLSMGWKFIGCGLAFSVAVLGCAWWLYWAKCAFAAWLLVIGWAVLVLSLLVWVVQGVRQFCWPKASSDSEKENV